jgi:hypothetical protein
VKKKTRSPIRKINSQLLTWFVVSHNRRIPQFLESGEGFDLWITKSWKTLIEY